MPVPHNKLWPAVIWWSQNCTDLTIHIKDVCSHYTPVKKQPTVKHQNAYWAHAQQCLCPSLRADPHHGDAPAGFCVRKREATVTLAAVSTRVPQKARGSHRSPRWWSFAHCTSTIWAAPSSPNTHECWRTSNNESDWYRFCLVANRSSSNIDNIL